VGFQGRLELGLGASMTCPSLAAWADCEAREKAAAMGELLRRELRRGKSEEKGRKKDWSRGERWPAKEDGETLASAIPNSQEHTAVAEPNGRAVLALFSSPKNFQNFPYSRHIESLDVCMEY